MSDYRLIPLHGKHGEGKFAKVSPEDYEHFSQFNWILRSDGYVQRTASRSEREQGRKHSILMHREVLRLAGDVIADHRFGDKLDNRREFLREATTKQNSGNSKKQNRRGGTTSRFKGVSRPRSGRWFAYIRANGAYIYLGRFDKEIDAAKAYNVAALEHFGEFARLNTIE